MSLYIAITKSNLVETTKIYDTTIAVDYNGGMYGMDATLIITELSDGKRKIDVDVKSIDSAIIGIERDIVSKIKKGELVR